MPTRTDPSAAAFDATTLDRRSVRAFRGDPVEPGLVLHLLDLAARAPSGTNMQPWRAHVLAGAAKHELSAALVAAQKAGETLEADYRYYPKVFPEPYLSRRRKVGWDLYGLLGIAKGDAERMQAQHDRNLVFFDAPVGMIFTIDRRLEIGSWLDYGMFLQGLMLAAGAHGLATCAQASFASFGAVIRRHLGLPDGDAVVCGMALGFEDVDAPENRLRTERVPARDFATFMGFDEDPASLA